jgi:hypothetical protein
VHFLDVWHLLIYTQMPRKNVKIQHFAYQNSHLGGLSAISNLKSQKSERWLEFIKFVILLVLTSQNLK